MAGRDNPFLPPTLHLLIVDDDQDDWTPRLQKSFEDYLANWGPYRLGLFAYEPHHCRSKEGFQETTTRLLEAGELVYAAVDLILPRKDTDQKPDPTLWNKLIFWCLERIKATTNRNQIFDFCVMSADQTALDELYSDAQHGRDLQSRGIKRVSKTAVDQSPMPEGHLAPLWDDVRNFIRSHIACCQIPEGGASSNWSTMIWFGDDPKLSELRYQADRIAKQRHGDLYLLFSDATGYEEDWFRLTCQLRGTSSSKIKILSLRDVRPDRNPEWDQDFRTLPEMLLITHTDSASEHGCDLGKIFHEVDFFNRIKESRTSHVFIQFPYVSGEQSLSLTLAPEERTVLDLCLHRVGAPPSSELDTGFAYSKNRQILHFPSYIELKIAGVIRQTVEFEAQQCRRQFQDADCPLHPEVAAVLSEIPWQLHEDGLYELRQAIRHAYKRASNALNNSGRSIGEEQFPEKVREILRSSLGFSLRGRWLFDRLSQRRSFTPIKDPAAEMLRGLEGVHDLYDGLERLAALHQTLIIGGENTSSADFPEEHFQALQRAHEFLNLVFASKNYLGERIERFRKIVEDQTLHDRFREYYPSLRERENWRELVEQMRFVWPYDMFPLPSSVSEYLRHSNVVAEFHPDFQAILRRYPLLAEKWEKLDQERKRLRELLQDRETQRWDAECFVRDCESQPVCIPLTEEIGKFKHPGVAFDMALRSLLFFNANLAICENYYIFSGDFLDPEDVRKQIKCPDLWQSIVLINKYIRHLQKAQRIKETILTRWRDSWPILGKQPDAVRLAVRICQWLERNGTLRDSDLESVSRLTALGDYARHCPITDLFDMLRVIRNSHNKTPIPKIWEEQGERIWELLRRFVSATTHPALRLGFSPENEERPLFWSRRGALGNGTSDGIQNAVVRRLSVYLDPSKPPLFPIDELVRVNPQDSSLWGAYSAGEDWFNLTYVDAGDSRRTPGQERPWLASKEHFLSSNIWRYANAKK